MTVPFPRAIVAAVLLVLAGSPTLAADAPRPSKPNILFILADDLGYGDVGFLNQNARAAAGEPAFSTPHIDALAASGLVLRQHYTGAPVCAPARASLMTGMAQGTCPIRDNQFDKPLPPDLLTLGSLLHNAGYRTAAIGKWGLGGHGGAEGFPAHPMKRGFDDYFGFMRHGFGHVYYHDDKHPLMDGLKSVRGEYENYYSTDLFTARAKQFITQQHEKRPDQPFFLYLAYTAVHMILQVPGEPYPAGSGLHGGLQWPLQPTPQTRDTWIHPDYADKPWTEPMKRYATMARRLDDGVGDILQLLKDLHIDRDTLIVFTSDNGPEFSSGADPRLFGSWGPFDGFKRDCFEGGVREPTLAAWPGHIAPHSSDNSLTGFWDWMPTFADLAGLPAPAQSDGISLVPTLLHSGSQRTHPYVYIEYDFKQGPNPKGPVADVASRKGAIRGQQQLVRIGDFVGVRTQIKSPTDPLRLYNVTTDPHEDHNLANDPTRAGLLKQMNDLLVAARVPEPDSPRPYDNVPLPAVPAPANPTPGLTLSLFPGTFPYTPDLATLTPASRSITPTLSLPANLPAGPFAASFTGTLTVPADGTYTFTASADAGVHLWVHDAHLFDAEHTSGPLTASIPLKAGPHPIRLTYLHRSGPAKLDVRISSRDLSQAPVAASALFTTK